MSSRVRARGHAAWAVLVVVIAATACRVDATVDVTVDRGGAGRVLVEVVLDSEAADELGDEATRVRVDDLREAGWSVESPDSVAGGLRLSASKPFRGPDDLRAVLTEVAGSDGWLRDWSLEVTNAFARTTYQLSGAVELSSDLRELGDAQTAAALDGLPLGRTPDEMAASFGGPDDGASVTVDLSVPGAAPVSERIELEPGRPGRGEVSVEGTVTSRRTQLLLVLTLVVAAAGVLLLVGGRFRARPGSPRSPDRAPASE